LSLSFLQLCQAVNLPDFRSYGEIMPSQKTNLILISLDTLRADVAYHSGMKNFDKLCRRGTCFLNTVASSPLTPISHSSVMTGLQPFEHGVRHLLREQISTPKPLLAEVMGSAGYATGAIVSCPGMNRWYGLDRGFQHYDDEIPRLADGRDPLKVADVKIRGTALKRAPLVVERGLKWLKANRHRPFFLFIHFFDAHWPYEAPEQFGAPEANPYEGEVHYVDHYLGRFLDQVHDWGLEETTLVTAFGDHGEDLAGWYQNDHAGHELGHPEENGHGCLLFDATQMVPLVFAHPSLVPPNTQIRRQVRLVDILPTISNLLGAQDPVERAGSSLTEFFAGDAPDRLAYCETYYREEQGQVRGGIPGLNAWQAVRIANRYKVITDVRSGYTSVYDLVADANEKQPITFPNALPLEAGVAAVS
jgi:arylsulfatase